MTILGDVKAELLIADASNLKNRNNRPRSNYGDIFPERLGVTLSLTYDRSRERRLFSLPLIFVTAI